MRRVVIGTAAAMAVVGLVAGLVAGLGWLEQNPPLMEVPSQTLWDWGNEVDEGRVPEPLLEAQFGIGADGVVSLNGEEIGQVAKTQTTDASMSVAGTLSLLNQEHQHLGWGRLATESFVVGAAGVECGFRDITEEGGFEGIPKGWPEEDPDGEYDWFAVIAYIRFAEVQDYEILWFKLEEDYEINVEWEYSITVDYGQRVHREETLTESGPRDAAPAYAADRDVLDSWEDDDIHEFATYTVTFGPLSWSDSITTEPGEIQALPITGIALQTTQRSGAEGVQYGACTFEWDAVNTDLSRFHKVLDVWTFEGTSSGVEVWMTADSPAMNASHNIGIGMPRMWDFGQRYASVDRDGNPHSDLCLAGPWRASNHLPASLTWATTPDGLTFGAEPGDTVYPTVAELYAVGQYADPPDVGGLDYRDPDDEYKFLTGAGVMQATLTEASVQRDDLVELYGHYDGDLEIMMRVPPLSATTCSESPDVAGLMTLTANDGVGIYGPEDAGARALDHEDWAGGANTTTPDEFGAFVVSGGAGEISIDLPSNFGSRLDAVPQQNFPQGMEGYPTIYLFHRAGMWREFDGLLCPDEVTYHSEPLEAVYCWRGFPALDLSGWSVPADCELAITLDVTTYSIGDIHTTDSTRQTEADNTPSQAQYTYTVQATALGGIPPVMLGAPDEGCEPDLEVVTRITISGLAAGNWTLDEPELGRDPDSTETATVKIFESPRDDYRHGGYSAVVDHVCRYALVDSHETNLGSDTRIEPTVRMFDRLRSPLESPPPHFDLTSAWDRQQIASILHNVGDAFSCVADDEEFDAHYQDEDDAYLTQGYAFDFCAPFEGATRELEQEIGDINFAVRARSWRSVPGLLYTAWWDHVGGGAQNGQLVDADGQLARSDSGEEVWRQPQGASPPEWQQHDTTSSDGAGYYATISGPICADHDPEVLWEYALGRQGSLSSVGRWATREYRYAVATLLQTEPNLCKSPIDGRLWLVMREGQRIRCRVMESPQRGWIDRSNDVFEASGYTWPRIAAMSDGTLIVVATNPEEDGSTVRRSRDDGTTWETV